MLDLRIRTIRKARKLSGTSVAEKLGISPQHYYDIERGENRLSADNAVKLAKVFDVSLDYLLGQSINALIEKRLEQRGMTLEDLSEQTKIPLVNLQNLDSMTPGPWDYEKEGVVDRIARALSIRFSELQSAFARQEPPVYDAPTLSPEEVFKQIQDDFADKNFDEIQTIAAHHDGEDWTEEELEDIERFKAFIKSKRQ